MLHLLVEACYRVGFPTQFTSKRRRDMNASLFFNIAKRQAEHIIQQFVFTKKDGLLLNDNFEKNAGKWKRKRFLQDGVFFGPPLVQAWKQNSYSEKKQKSKIRAKYTSLQNVGVMKRAGWCIRPHHFVGSFFLGTQSFCRLFSRPHVL